MKREERIGLGRKNVETKWILVWIKCRKEKEYKPETNEEISTRKHRKRNLFYTLTGAATPTVMLLIKNRAEGRQNTCFDICEMCQVVWHLLCDVNVKIALTHNLTYQYALNLNIQMDHLFDMVIVLEWSAKLFGDYKQEKRWSGWSFILCLL